MAYGISTQSKELNHTAAGTTHQIDNHTDQVRSATSSARQAAEAHGLELCRKWIDQTRRQFRSVEVYKV
jgi:hypothetical protein